MSDEESTILEKNQESDEEIDTIDELVGQPENKEKNRMLVWIVFALIATCLIVGSVIFYYLFFEKNEVEPVVIAEPKMKEKIKSDVKIIVKDYFGNVLVDFPLNLYNKIYRTNEKGEAMINIFLNSNQYIESGNKDWRIMDEFCRDSNDNDCRLGYQDNDTETYSLGHRIKFETAEVAQEIRMFVSIPNIGDHEYFDKYIYPKKVVTEPLINEYLRFKINPPKFWNIETIKPEKPKTRNSSDYFNDQENFIINYWSPYVPQDKITMEVMHENFAPIDELCEELDSKLSGTLNVSFTKSEAYPEKKNCFKINNVYLLFNHTDNAGGEIDSFYKSMMDSFELLDKNKTVSKLIKVVDQNDKPISNLRFMVVSTVGNEYETNTITTNKLGEMYLNGEIGKTYYIRNYDDYDWKIDDDFCTELNVFDCRFHVMNIPNKNIEFPWGHKIKLDDSEEIEIFKMEKYTISNGDYFNKEIFENLKHGL